MTVDKAELEERIGQLSPAKVDAIRAGLQVLFERS
jgi:mRNA-degrading endonuclease toxin of MazEF toxin-antitoxin module